MSSVIDMMVGALTVHCLEMVYELLDWDDPSISLKLYRMRMKQDKRVASMMYTKRLCGGIYVQ